MVMLHDADVLPFTGSTFVTVAVYPPGTVYVVAKDWPDPVFGFPPTEDQA